MPPGSLRASATSTSPVGSTWIQRGCFRPAANALTLSPEAAVGVWPWDHPLAVGIFRVGMPCDLAAGITGALPKAGLGSPSFRCRTRIATAPISATICAIMPEKLMGFLQGRAIYPHWCTLALPRRISRQQSQGDQCSASYLCYTTCPAAQPDDQAHWKLYPPSQPVTS